MQPVSNPEILGCISAVFVLETAEFHNKNRIRCLYEALYSVLSRCVVVIVCSYFREKDILYAEEEGGIVHTIILKLLETCSYINCARTVRTYYYYNYSSCQV